MTQIKASLFYFSFFFFLRKKGWLVFCWNNKNKCTTLCTSFLLVLDVPHVSSLYVTPSLAQSLISLRSLFKAQFGLSVFQSERGQSARQKQEFRPEKSWNREKPKLISRWSALGLTPRGANRHQGLAHVHRKVLKRPSRNVTSQYSVEVHL